MQGITPKKKKRMRMMRRLRAANKEMNQANPLSDESAKLNITPDDVENYPGVRNGGNILNLDLDLTLDSSTPATTPATSPEPVQSEEEGLREAYKNMPFDEKDNDEWILVALVMDSLLGWISFALFVMTTSMVLLIVPVYQMIRHN